MQKIDTYYRIRKYCSLQTHVEADQKILGKLGKLETQKRSLDSDHLNIGEDKKPILGKIRKE